MLRRKLYDTLQQWKKNHRKECLLVKGARQVGKTFIIDKFGSENYASYLSSATWRRTVLCRYANTIP